MWVFLTSLKDAAKPIINTWNRRIIVSQVNILRIWPQIICLMSQYLPYNKFKWLKKKRFNISSISDNISHRKMLQADPEYPNE